MSITAVSNSRSGNPAKRNLPNPKRMVFDLDTLERENAPEPFVVRVAGEEFVFADPMTIDWQHANGIDISDIGSSTAALLGDEQYARFCKLSLPLWKIVAMSKQIEAHYAGWLGEPGEEPASSTS
jgi:hypothetical protein